MQDTHTMIIPRGVGESLRLGDDVIVRVERIEHGKVWLRVDAPHTMPVHRGEVAEAIRRELGR